MAFDPSKTKYEMPPSDLTDAQNILLSVLSVPVSFLSVCASTTLIYMVMSQTRQTTTTSLDRILILMSLYDICWSIQACLQGFLAPPDVSQRATAWGNEASCNALGFFFQFGGAVFWYNGILSFYFMITIVYGWTERRFQKIAPYLHVFSFLYSFTTACLGLILGWYYTIDLGSGCWISHYPRGCRGEECRSDEIGWIVAGYPTCALIAFVIVSNLRIYCHVRRTMQRSFRHRVLDTMNDTQSQRIKQVAIQCFLYVLAFWCTITPWIIIRGLDGVDYLADNESKIFPLLIVNSLAAPSTGCFNLLIYLRPKYKTHRQKYPHQSFLWVLRRTIVGTPVSSETCHTSDNVRRPGHVNATAVSPAADGGDEEVCTRNESKVLPLEIQESALADNTHWAATLEEPEIETNSAAIAQP